MTIARALIQSEVCSIPLQLLNPREEEVTLPKGAVVAELETVTEDLAEEMGIATVLQNPAQCLTQNRYLLSFWSTMTSLPHRAPRFWSNQ